MARNALSAIPWEAIQILKNLNQIYLSENRIEKIAKNTFQGEVMLT